MKVDRNDKIANATQFSPEQILVLKNTVAKNTTDTELTYFIMLSQSLNLNPFNKEIWAYKDGKGNLITLAGRDGFLKIAQKSKRWNGILSCEVRKGDQFEIDMFKAEIIHKPNFKERGEILGAYCYIKPKDCETATIIYVDFNAYNKGYNVWKSHPSDMIKKVAEIKALKQAFGISGLQSEHDFDIVNDTAHAIDTEGTPSPETLNHIDRLIMTSTYDDEMKAKMESELYSLNNSQCDEMKANLLANQKEPDNLSQKDIHKKLDIIEKQENK